VTISLGQQLPDGPWDADLKLRSGLIEDSVQARIQFPRDPGAAVPVVPATPQKVADFSVLTGVLLALAALAIALLVIVVRRRRERRKAARDSE
jgi:hypothetical protein